MGTEGIGFEAPSIKTKPTDEAERVLGRNEKQKQAEIGVKKMFDKEMTTPGVIRRIKTNEGQE